MRRSVAVADWDVMIRGGSSVDVRPAIPDRGRPSTLLAIIHRNAAGDVTSVEVVAQAVGSVQNQIAELVGRLKR